MENEKDQEIARLTSIISAQNEALDHWRKSYDGIVSVNQRLFKLLDLYEIVYGKSAIEVFKKSREDNSSRQRTAQDQS